MEKLTSYYQELYQKEAHAIEIPTYSYTPYPSNRFDGCIKYFTDHFVGGSVLELAAGSGIVAKALLKNRSITSYTANDLSQNRLDGLSHSINDSRLSSLQFNVEESTEEVLENKQYDAIIMVALIEHLIDPLSVMRKLKKHLTPNGFIYIDTPNIASYGCRYKLLRGKFPSTASKCEGLVKYDNTPANLYDEGHLHYFTYSSLEGMLVKLAGYSHTKKAPYIEGRIIINKKATYALAQWLPKLFSPTVIIAYP